MIALEKAKKGSFFQINVSVMPSVTFTQRGIPMIPISRSEIRGGKMKRILCLCLVFMMFTIAMGACIGEVAPIYVLPWYCDSLVNRSNLSDAEIWSHIEGRRYRELAELLDKDGDNIADGTGILLDEFIVRIEIVITRNRAIERQRMNAIAGMDELEEDDI